MKADLDFDIVAHLGNIRNVDLLSKGIYIVQIKLYYGVEGNLIAPVGMFSSPSTICSTVQSQTLPVAPVCSMCEVHDGLRCFRTRSIIVRYKDERYELNDGVHWRLTLPACNISVEENASCPKPLHLKFELLYAAFLAPPADVKIDLMNEVHKLIPEDPQYSVVATQNLVVEKAGSGIHAYYPVHFNGSNIAELDCMVHCAITGIRFPSLSPKPEEPLEATPAATEETTTPDLAQRRLPDLPPPPESSSSGSSDTTTATATSPATSSKTLVDHSTLPSDCALTPVKSKLPTDDASERDGDAASSLRTPTRPGDDNTDLLTAGAAFTTPSGKRASQRYVPSVSPHTTKLEAPVDAGSAVMPAPLSAMRRMSGHISHWRNSLTSSLSSPVPLMGKVSEAGVASARKLGALTSALASPIATRLRIDGGGGGGGGAPQMADDSITPARAEERGEAIDLNSLVSEGPVVEQVASTASSSLIGDIDQEENEGGQRSALIEAEEMRTPALDPILDPEGWLNSYALCVAANYKAMHSGIKSILDLYAYVQQSDSSSTASDKQGGVQAESLQSLCLFETQRSEMMVEILLCSDEAERVAIVKEKVDLSNLQVTMHWSTLMTALRRVMPQLCPLLREEYRRAARAFWRGQVLIQTKSFTNTTSYSPAETQLLLDIVNSLIARDEEAHSVGEDFAAQRKLRIYDVDMMQRVAKLPHMVLQQYYGAESSGKPSIALLNAKLAAERGVMTTPKEMPTTKLRWAIQTAQSALAAGAPLPAGTLFLSRGGELLDETAASALDGQVVDLARYPALVPLLQLAPVLSDASPEASSATTSESSSGRDWAGRSEDTPAVPAVVKTLPQLDFVAAHRLEQEASKASAPVHLVVLQHGFLGQGFDMQMIENALRLELGFSVETFVPRSNEGKEHDSIAQMGKRLAFELIQFCKEYHPELLHPGSKPRLSFIGHSMGGLIVRQALQEPSMKPLYSNLHAYVSLATPHVGALFPDSKIVSTGMWALFKWKKYKALKELVLEDSLGGKVSKTLLFKLAEHNALSHFHKVVLLFSPKDQYVPAYSARIQTSQRSEESSAETGAAVTQMVQNLLQPLRAEQVVRITMDNNVGEGVDVNSLIGRTAHICYLENPVAAKALVYSIAPYLQ